MGCDSDTACYAAGTCQEEHKRLLYIFCVKHKADFTSACKHTSIRYSQDTCRSGQTASKRLVYIACVGVECSDRLVLRVIMQLH